MINLLGIAPYEGLKNMMLSLAKQRDDIYLDVYEGDYHSGLEIVQSLDLSTYDAIISRGGTADLIREACSTPVVSIDLSHYDILTAIRLAMNYDSKFALVGFPGTAKFAAMLSDILQYDIPVYTTHNESDVEQRILQLISEGIELVVGDNMVVTCARMHHIQGILITSGMDSIMKAFDQAILMVQYTHKLHEINSFYQTALRSENNYLIVLTENAHILFSDLPDNLQKIIYPAAKRLNKGVFRKHYRQFTQTISNHLYVITGQAHIHHGQIYAFYLVQQSSFTSILSETDIEVKSKDAISDTFMRLFYNGVTTQSIRQKLHTYQYAPIVVIVGEAGTGKDAIAEQLYCNGLYSDSVLYTIDCEQLSEKQIQQLLNAPESPIFAQKHAIYFKHIHCLNPESLSILIRIIQHIGSNNQWLFSLSRNTSTPDYESKVYQQLVHALSAIVIELPSLRARIPEIPNFICFYLNELSTRYPHQVSGVEPEGMDYLQSFHWSENFRQLCRIIETLFHITSTAYINVEDVRTVLNNEQQPIENSKTDDTVPLDLNQPLNDIIHDLIQLILQEENMTQTKAAQRLGICRTTLWKYLKK